MLSTEDPKSIETVEIPPNKKIKLSSSSSNIQIPSEIWLKIMNYLPTEDIFLTFALLNKRLNGLTKDSKAIKYLSLNSQIRPKQAMKILKRSTGLVGLSMKQTSYYGNSDWVGITRQALKANIKSLKTLHISIKDGHCDCNFSTCEVVHGTNFDPELVELVQALKVSKIILHTLKLKGFMMNPKVLIEISKLKSLKTLSIMDTKQTVVTLEVIESFIKNSNQLEAIEIIDKDKDKYNFEDTDDFGEDEESANDEMKAALNELFGKKNSMLKSIKLLNLGVDRYFSRAGSNHQCVPLDQLSLCQNLEEFCGNLHSCDIKTLSTLPNLKKLKFNGIGCIQIQDLEYVLSNMDLSKLKYLSLYDKQYIREPLHEKLASHSFSALERLCIKSMSKKSLKQLIKSCPKLKSIQFPSGNFYHEIPNKVLYNAFKDKRIFIIFDKAIKGNDKKNREQKSFEDYLEAHDLKEFKRYRRVKNDFSKWCETNFGYGY